MSFRSAAGSSAFAVGMLRDFFRGDHAPADAMAALLVLRYIQEAMAASELPAPRDIERDFFLDISEHADGERRGPLPV